MQKFFTTLYSTIFFIFLFGANQAAFPQVIEQDSLALVALYNSTDGANWVDKTNWLTGPVPTWFGITVTGDRVTKVEIRWNNLVGQIPPEIGNLTELTYLSLIQNKLSGPIPHEIGNLNKLVRLFLSSNQLSDSIPPEIGNLSNLQFLGLEVNKLSGPIPVEIGNLSNLIFLTLNQNNFSGSIPVELFNLTELRTLLLNVNKLSGVIPPQVGNLTKVEILSFAINNLEGPLPAEIQNLTQLFHLSVGYNQLTGTIPNWIGNLTNLTDLTLSGNLFSGAIPKEIGNLTNLSTLYISQNELSDTIPAEIGNLVNLTQLFLDNNQLLGAVPSGFANLIKLQALNLSYNHLTDLPDLSGDTSLIDLQVQNNKFTFEDIEPNLFVVNFNYSPQELLGEERDTTINHGSNFEFSVSVGGSANQYQWIKDGDDIPGAQSNSYIITSADSTDAGSYICRITNTLANNLTLYTNRIQLNVSTSVDASENGKKMPLEFDLSQNYPNPFNPSTVIEYKIPSKEFVTLTVFDVLGREVRQLVNEEKNIGIYSVEFNADNLSSGIYYYILSAGNFSDVKKLLLIK
ncbi:MAG: T9SS type A sorting domain-containing protein [Ignavibacteriaceae bacterium]|nr:T9SS type A sorting domain-containing protein [Ignavibacteriaceae bacterium]